MPYISKERCKIAKVDDTREVVPDYLHAVLSTDGGMTQMKALQDMDSLKEKVKRNIDQVKFAKKASAVQQPCNAGNLHVQERHHSRHVSLSDVPRIDLLNPSDSVEHPLLESFAKQHHQQRFTIMTNPLVLGDFATAFGGNRFIGRCPGRPA